VGRWGREKLGAAWKKLLGESTNAELGVDEEFTRPGVTYPFEWKP
jgi:hypothetical protein